MKYFAVVALACIALCQASTTRRPHATHEPTETEGISFYYSSHTHNLIVKSKTSHTLTCYIAALTQQEMKSVHSDSGFRQIEIRVLNAMPSATPVSVNALQEYDVKACGHGPHNTTANYMLV